MNSSWEGDSESPFLAEDVLAPGLFVHRAPEGARASAFETLATSLFRKALADDFESALEIEHEPPQADAPVTRDTLLAVPGFAAVKRSLVGQLLTSNESAAAIRWNAARHPRRSGLSADDISQALAAYVDVTAIGAAIDRYNVAHPRAAIQPGTDSVNAVFVEAIHQFQLKCYREPKHSGMAVEAVLDSLGFWPRRGLLTASQTNDWARQRVRSSKTAIEVALATSTELTRDLTYANWWSAFVNPSFLGWGFARPIHLYFARKLRKAELWLLSQPRCAGLTPVELADLFGIDERHAGGRNRAGSGSIHTLGLGIDIKYRGNPYVRDPNTLSETTFSAVMRRAMAQISGLRLTDERFSGYLHRLGTDTTMTTAQVHAEIVLRDRDLRQYLALPEARTDRQNLADGVYRGESVHREPRNGFLNLDVDLVVALRDKACLVWGAVDFGARGSGDIMHFDCRLDELGRAVFCGTVGIFNTRHPCWTSTNPACPEPPRQSARARGRGSNELFEPDDEPATGGEGESDEEGERWESDYELDADEHESGDDEYLGEEDEKERDDFKLKAGCAAERDEDHEDESEADDAEADEAEAELLEEAEELGGSALLEVSLLRDDFKTAISESEIIGLDGVTANLQLTTTAADAVDRDGIEVQAVFRTPGKAREHIVSRKLRIPKHGVDPRDSKRVVFRLSISESDLAAILKPIDRTKEIATVRRIDGTSDACLIKALGSSFKLRGQAEQAADCGLDSGSLHDERPDALKLFQAGGVALLEIRDAADKVRTTRFVRNPADVFYYSGHGIGHSGANCLAIEDQLGRYCCWAGPSDLIPHWKRPMDLDALIIAACSVLAVDASGGGAPHGDGLAWAKLVNSGPLLYLLGYGDCDNNEPNKQGTRGPIGGTAPHDRNGGNTIASEIGKWIKANPGLKGIVRQWLVINFNHKPRQRHSVGFDRTGHCFRTRDKPTSGWTTVERLKSRDNSRFVIEKLKIT